MGFKDDVIAAAEVDAHDIVPLYAKASLFVGIFVGLSLLPVGITGPVGSVVGGFLWKYLGLGSPLISLLFFGLALAGFGRLGGLSFRRTGILFGGLILVVPLAVGIASGIRAGGTFPPAYESWGLTHRLVGIIPGMITVGVTNVVGTAGAVLLS